MSDREQLAEIIGHVYGNEFFEPAHKAADAVIAAGWNPPVRCEVCRWNAGFGARKPEAHNEDCPIPQMLEEKKPSLDPQPWILNSSGVFGVRGSKDGGSSSMGWYWSFAPRPEYEQDKEKYA